MTSSCSCHPDKSRIRILEEIAQMVLDLPRDANYWPIHYLKEAAGKALAER